MLARKGGIMLDLSFNKWRSPIKWRKVKCVGHILRRNCLLKHIVKGKTDSKGRGERRRKLLLNDLNEKRRYGNFKEETLNCHWEKFSFEEFMDISQDSDHIMDEYVFTDVQNPQTQICKKMKLCSTHDNFISLHNET
jgi:hypothetical protein